MKTELLLAWYHKNKRDLPWRKTRDPYAIWISEVMLQQTTVLAAMPYYDRFLTRFPTLEILASAQLEDVYEFWSGLGYYSRARNLHRAAQLLGQQKSFPTTAAELQNYPGFGPYTSRAVASFAFEDPVGVLDGNVIRVWSRFHGKPFEHWKSAEKSKMQSQLDELAQSCLSSDLNQALMELGATTCTSHKPLCLLCPLADDCQARQNNQVSTLPLMKPRRKMETWLWEPLILEKDGKIAFTKACIQNSPVLKDQWILPGAFQKLEGKPKVFQFKHTITHHQIYVHPVADAKTPDTPLTWLARSEIKQKSPFQLIQRAVGLLLMTLIYINVKASPHPATATSLLTSPENFYFLGVEGVSVQNDDSRSAWRLKEHDGKKWVWQHREDENIQMILQLSKESESETDTKKLLRDFHNTGFDVIRNSSIQLKENGQLFELFDPLKKKQLLHYVFKKNREVAQWVCLFPREAELSVRAKDCSHLVQTFTWMTNPKTNSSKDF